MALPWGEPLPFQTWGKACMMKAGLFYFCNCVSESNKIYSTQSTDLVCFMFWDHYAPRLLAPPLPRWNNSAVCAVTESSGTSVCQHYGFSEAVLRETADLVLKHLSPFLALGKITYFWGTHAASLPQVSCHQLDLGICLFTLTWLSTPARCEGCCLFPGLLLLLLLLDEKLSGDNLQVVLEFRYFTRKPNTGVSVGSSGCSPISKLFSSIPLGWVREGSYCAEAEQFDIVVKPLFCTLFIYTAPYHVGIPKVGTSWNKLKKKKWILYLWFICIF